MDRVQLFFFFFWKAQKTDIERNTRNAAIVFDPRIRRRRRRKNAKASSRFKISVVFFFFFGFTISRRRPQSARRAYAHRVCGAVKNTRRFVGVTVCPPARRSCRRRQCPRRRDAYENIRGHLNTVGRNRPNYNACSFWTSGPPKLGRREWFIL